MGFLPLFLKFAPPLILPVMQVIEAAFGAKRGSDKMAATVKAVGPVIEELGKAGILPEVPQGEELAAVLELVFQANRQRIEAAKESPVSITAPAGHRVIFLPDDARIVSVEFGAK